MRKLSVSGSGYLQFLTTTRSPKKVITFAVHRVVAQAFIPNPSGFDVVNHIDGNKLNNQVDNLEWTTHAYNLLHAVNVGLRKDARGEAHHNAVINSDDVKNIIVQLLSGVKQKDIAAQYSITPTSVGNIKKGKTWQHVTIVGYSPPYLFDPDFS